MQDRTLPDGGRTPLVSEPLGLAVGAAVLTALIVGLGSPGTDFAAHAYQSALFDRRGFGIWDNSWYAAGVRTSASNASYWRPAVAFLRTRQTPSYRVEAVDTVGHWPALHLARAGIPLGRGWFRQDDFPQNAVLYRPLTPASYASRSTTRPIGAASAGCVREARDGMTRLTVPHAGRVMLAFSWTPERALDVVAGSPASDCSPAASRQAADR